MIEWKTFQVYLMLFIVYLIGGWYTGMFNGIAVMFGMMFLCLIFGYYEFFVYRKYPIIVPLFIRRKGSWSFMLDRASRNKDENGVDYYKLRSSKKTAKPPRFENIIETVKGYVLPLFSPSQDEYRELTIKDDGSISIMDEDMKAWYKYRIKKAYTDWAPEMSKWIRYMPIIFLAVLGGIVIVVLYIITGDLSVHVASMTQAIDNTVNGLKGLQTVVVPPQ
jgi:hypothetical protein